MSDTISNDPKLMEEARRVAAEATNPKPPYDPKAIAREEWERVVDKRYEMKTFDEVWDRFNKLTDSMLSSMKRDLKGTITENEYRQFASSLYLKVNSQNLIAAAQRAEQRGEVTSAAVMYAIKDKYSVSETVSFLPDLARGLIYQDTATADEKRTCPLHPNGCPPPGVEVMTGTDALSALLGILDRARKK
jgi:hypothetical protein